MIKQENENIKKILVIRLSSIGDIILTSELIRLLRKRFPDSKIDYLIQKEFKELLENNIRVDNLIEYDKKLSLKEIKKLRDELLNGEKYDLVVDLHNNIRTRHWRKGTYKELLKVKKYRLEKLALVHFNNSFNSMPHVTDRYLNTISDYNIEKDNRGLEIWLEGETAYKATENNEVSDIIGIAPGAKHFTKMFPNEKLILLFEKLLLIYKSSRFKIFGIKEDKFISSKLKEIGGERVIDFCGELTLLQTAKEIDECDVLISNDSGLMHLAAARKVPTLAIFGSTVPQFGFTPYGNRSEIIEVDLDCRPCTHIGRDKCPKSHFNCMNMIKIEDIITKLGSLKNANG